MRRTLPLSAGLHLLLALAALSWRAPRPVAPDEPARIELVFGASDRVRTLSAVAPRAPPGPTADDPATPPPVAPPAPPRPDSAAPGVRVERPDPTIIPARDRPDNRAPAYPEAARRLRQHGTVLLRLYIATDGSVTRVEALRSSGVAVLDSAAIAALARWHFLPAEENGQAVASTRDQPVSFVLGQ